MYHDIIAMPWDYVRFKLNKSTLRRHWKRKKRRAGQREGGMGRAQGRRKGEWTRASFSEQFAITMPHDVLPAAASE